MRGGLQVSVNCHWGTFNGFSAKLLALTLTEKLLLIPDANLCSIRVRWIERVAGKAG